MRPIQATLLIVILLGCGATSAQAVLWNKLSGGPYNFNDTANWVGGVVPNGGAAVADMSGDYTSNVVATLNSSVTLGQLYLGDTVGSNGSIQINTTGGAAFTLNNGVSRAVIRGLSGSSNIVNPNLILQNDGEFQVQAANTLTVNGVISGAFNLYLGDTGGTYTGRLVLTGANSYTATTNVQYGVLNIRHNTALGTIASGTSVSSGAALEIQNNISVGAETLNLNGTGVANGGALRNISGTNQLGGQIRLATATRINSDAGTLTLTNNIVNDVVGSPQNLTVGGAGAVTLSGIVANGAGTLTKDGGGTLTLGGPNNNVFTGLTTVSNGILVMNKSNAGAGRNATAGNVLVSGGTLRWDKVDQLPAASQVTMTSGTLNVNLGVLADEFSKLDLQGGTVTGLAGAQLRLNSTADDAITVRGGVTVPINLGLTSGSGGGLTFDASNNGTATLSGGLVLSGANKNVVVGDGSAATDLQFTGVVSESGGSFGFTKSGAGTLSLGGSSHNTYTGLTTVSDGVLALNKTAGFNATAGNLLVNGGTLRWDVANQLPTAQVTMTSGAIQSNVFDGFGKLDLQGGTLTGSGQFNLADNANDAVKIRGGVSADLLLALTSGTAGGLTFDASNNGTATLSKALIITNADKNIVVGNGAALVDLQFLQGVAQSGGPYGITKSGVGTLLLAGTSNYQGATNVDQGRLLVNGTLNSGGAAVVVASGATLGGSGTINRAVNINAGGTLSPGNSPDQIFTGALTLAPLAIYEIEIFGPGVGDGVTGYDQTVVAGGVSLNGALLSLITVSNVFPSNTFTIIDNDGSDAVIGTFAGLGEGASFVEGNYTFTITYQGGVNNNDVVLTLTSFLNPVPEPGTLALLAGILCGGGAILRRRFRQAR